MEPLIKIDFLRDYKIDGDGDRGSVSGSHPGGHLGTDFEHITANRNELLHRLLGG